MTGEPTTAAVIADYLRAAGVRQVYTYPGDPIIELMEALRRAEVEVVLARREGTAAFMAEAGAMATGIPGVCLSTLGPGSTALVNGVAAATLDRVPMVAMSGQIATAREQIFTHQVVDHKMLFASVTKWAGRVEAGAAATTMRKALRTAVAERPGAVHLTIAGDTVKAPATDHEVAVPPLTAAAGAVTVHRSPGGPDAHRLLASARRPVLLAGTAAVRCGAGAAVARLAETAGLPVVVAPMAKGVIAEDHAYFAGVLDMACNQVMWDLLRESDLVVTAGFDPVELIKPWTLRAPVLHIDTTPNTDQVYASGCEVVGDIGAILDWLSDDWTGELRWSPEQVETHRDRLRAAYYSGRVGGRLNPTDVLDTLRAATPRETVLTCDVGSHKLLVGQGWQAYRPRSVLMTNGLSAMGLGVPGAIAAALAGVGGPVVAAVGDGGFAMTATEMRLASSLGLPVAVVVFADNSLNRIELKQMADGYPSTATRLASMDLVKLAESMECDGVRCDSVAELEKAVAGIPSLSRPLIIDARIDPTQYEAQF